MTEQDIINLVRIKLFGVQAPQKDFDERISLYYNLAHKKIVFNLIKYNPITAENMSLKSVNVVNGVVGGIEDMFFIQGFYKDSDKKNKINYVFENGSYKVDTKDPTIYVFGLHVNAFGDKILLPEAFKDLLLTQTLIDACIHEYSDYQGMQLLQKQLNKRTAEFLNFYSNGERCEF